MGAVVPSDLQRQWIQGTGPATRPRSATASGSAQRRLRAAFGRRRLDVRRRGRARPGRDDVARQPAQPQAGHRRGPAVPGGGRAGRRRDERTGPGASSAARSIDDWREQLDFTTRIFRARGLHLDDRHVRARRRRGLLGVDRRPRPLRRQQPRAAARRRRLGRPVPAEDPDRRGGGALERMLLDALEDAPRACRAAPSRSTCWSSRSRRASS